ncbi:MAG: helix-turn-helix domain-containing protein [Trueperaceae bacterium]
MDAGKVTTDTLGAMLREARVAKGLELNDIAEITHVRKEYLQALEDARYGDLPEDIYARNFLRLYAQAVGLDDAKLLERFSRERRVALGIGTMSEVTENGYRDVAASRRVAPLPLAVLLLALVGISFFVFNRLAQPNNATNADVAVGGETQETSSEVENATSTSENTNTATEPGTIETGTTTTGTTTASEPATTPETSAEAVATPETATSEMTTPETTMPETTMPETTPDTSEVVATGQVPAGDVTAVGEGANTVPFTLVTDPPGAEVTLDNYPFPFRTPFFNAPVTPREARVLRITLEGYEPYEELLDITGETSKAVTLVSLNAEATPPQATTETEASQSPVATTAQGQIGVRVEAATWLEVYQSTVRGEGERLVYATVNPGQTFSFNLPVFIHVGNASGVRLSQEGQDLGLMGNGGEVKSRSFGQPLPVTPAPIPVPEPTPAPTDPVTEGPQ